MSSTDGSNESGNIGFYASIVSSSLLVVSELLPYISKIKGNGIIQVLMNAFTKYDETKKQEQAERDRKIQEILDKLDQLASMVSHNNASNVP